MTGRKLEPRETTTAQTGKVPANGASETFLALHMLKILRVSIFICLQNSVLFQPS